MVDSNARKIASAALQYSKWLSRFICWVWAIFRFLVLVASVIRPNASEALASTIAGIDTIMLVNEGTYLVNSLGEKYLYSDQFVLTWLKRNAGTNIMSDDDDEQEEEPIDDNDIESETADDANTEVDE